MSSLGVRALTGAVAAFVLLAAAAAPASEAYKLGGKKWRTRTITYHSSAPQFKSALKAAVQAWNSSGVRIRFKPAPKRRAKLLISYSPRSDGASGRAVLGWIPTQWVTEKRHGPVPVVGNVPCGLRFPLPNGRLAPIRCTRTLQRPRMWLKKLSRAQLRDPYKRWWMTRTAAHELGHVIGLDHVYGRSCALMSGNPPMRCFEGPNPWQVRCRLLQTDDLRGAIRRYGGKMRPPQGPEICDLAPAPEAVTDLSAQFDPATRSITATWRNPPTALGTRYVQLATGEGSCPTEPQFGYKKVQPGQAGSGTASDLSDEGGPTCMAVWTYDQYDRNSAPATVWVDVPPAPPSEGGGRGPRV